MSNILTYFSINFIINVINTYIYDIEKYFFPFISLQNSLERVT